MIFRTKLRVKRWSDAFLLRLGREIRDAERREQEAYMRRHTPWNPYGLGKLSSKCGQCGIDLSVATNHVCYNQMCPRRGFAR